MGIVIKPIVTEKMTAMGEKLNRFAFQVNTGANKIEIRITSYNVCYTKLLRYSMDITNPLVRSWDCFWITSGTIEKTIGDNMIVIDFGEGECDNIATKSVNGGDPEEFEMNCRIRRWKCLRCLF